MKFSELPIEFQEKLSKERAWRRGVKRNDGYEILIYNEAGTRYFYARRRCKPWSDDKGHYMPFGSGSYWELYYGAVQFRRTKTPLGDTDYELCDGKTYTSRTMEDGRKVEIPKTVPTKKEVVAVINALGIFKF